MINYHHSYPRLMAECSKEEIDAAQNYLLSYRLCEKMLKLRGYERKRAARIGTPENAEEIIQASEGHWELQVSEIKELINALPNGREKMVLYCHFIRGESVESAAHVIGISRRTAYRMLQKGLALTALALRERARERGDCQNEGCAKDE